jgi:hypothetical protein
MKLLALYLGWAAILFYVVPAILFLVFLEMSFRYQPEATNKYSAEDRMKFNLVAFLPLFNLLGCVCVGLVFLASFIGYVKKQFKKGE